MKNLGKINKFELIIDSKTHLRLSRSNLHKIVLNSEIVTIVSGIILQMEKDNVIGMTVNQSGYNLQVNRLLNQVK